MSRLKHFFADFARIIIRSFLGNNIFVHLCAVLLTAVCVWSGFDWYYFIHIQTLGTGIFLPALIFGSFLPIVLPLYLLLSTRFSFIKKDHALRAQRALVGRTLALAVLVGSAISSLYKIFTGRLQPNRFDLISNITHDFQFGFWRHGIFWGWPSSHTTIAFAMAFALIPFFKQNKLASALALAYAAYVGVGMSVGAHWFSDVISGALIGSVTGISTAKIAGVWKHSRA